MLTTRALGWGPPAGKNPDLSSTLNARSGWSRRSFDDPISSARSRRSVPWRGRNGRPGRKFVDSSAPRDLSSGIVRGVSMSLRRKAAASWVPPAVSLVGALLALAPVGTAKAQFIDSNLAVSPTTQMGGGGCYPVSIAPALLDMLTLLNPEWAAIDVGSHSPPFSDPITVHGTVHLAKINESGDFPSDHVTDDQNTFATLDASDQGLVATGNVGPHGVEAGQMELEWEISSYPLFAWAGTGDRYTGVGRWIWDCGHPDPDPVGNCSTSVLQQCAIDSDCAEASTICPACVAGETCVNVTFNYHSELHPPQAVAITRTHGYRSSKKVHFGKRATRTDVWINPDGGGAGDLCP